MFPFHSEPFHCRHCPCPSSASPRNALSSLSVPFRLGEKLNIDQRDADLSKFQWKEWSNTLGFQPSFRCRISQASTVPPRESRTSVHIGLPAAILIYIYIYIHTYIQYIPKNHHYVPIYGWSYTNKSLWIIIDITSIAIHSYPWKLALQWDPIPHSPSKSSKVLPQRGGGVGSHVAGDHEESTHHHIDLRAPQEYHSYTEWNPYIPHKPNSSPSELLVNLAV